MIWRPSRILFHVSRWLSSADCEKCSCGNIQPADSRFKTCIVFPQKHSKVFLDKKPELFNARKVPAGTLDLFCTQFTRLHSTSSLNSNCQQKYAAGALAFSLQFHGTRYRCCQ